MRLYVTRKGRWAGTMHEAKQLAKEEGTGWEQRDVPTDKDGLIGFLNAYSVSAMHGAAKAMIDAPRPEAVAQAPSSTSEAQAALGIGTNVPALRAAGPIALVATIDEPETNRIVEIIGQAKGCALARFASAVAVAYSGLGRKG